MKTLLFIALPDEGVHCDEDSDDDYNPNHFSLKQCQLEEQFVVIYKQNCKQCSRTNSNLEHDESTTTSTPDLLPSSLSTVNYPLSQSEVSDIESEIESETEFEIVSENCS